CCGGFPRLGVDTRRSNPWLEKSGPGRRTDLSAARGTRVHRMRQPSYRPVAEERLNQAQVIFGLWLTSPFPLSLHATKSGQRVPLLTVVRPRMDRSVGL